MNEIELIPRVGDLVKMKMDGDYGLVGVVHKIRTLEARDLAARRDSEPPRGAQVYDITWPDVRSVQYLSEIRVISRS
jgi:hypothetical protein